jgi:hypothetical protein
MTGFDVFCQILPFSRLFRADFQHSRRNPPLERGHSSLREHQIGKSEQREELRFVLGQAAIAHLAMTEQVLDHMEGMLTTRPDFRLGFLGGLISRSSGLLVSARRRPRFMAMCQSTLVASLSGRLSAPW